MRRLEFQGHPPSNTDSDLPPQTVQAVVPEQWFTEWARMLHNVAAAFEGTNLYDPVYDRPPSVEFPTPPELPDVLYHYTSEAGLRGILDSKVLWGTHVRHLDDESEWLHGFDLFKEKINLIPTNDEVSERIQRVTISMIEENVERFQSAVNIYVACVCRTMATSCRSL
jgi:hypothetical protein